MAAVSTNLDRLRSIWEQKKIAVIWRSAEKGERLRVRLPYAESNRKWLETVGPTKPEWDKARKYWSLPKAWFNDLVNATLERFGKVHIIQPYREQEKCSPACQNAKGHDCECSCMGRYHGAGNDGSWFEVSETFATRWGEKEWACRFLSRRAKPPPGASTGKRP